MGYAPVSNTRDNPPCNTLFIGNLGDNVNEQELQVLFGGQAVRGAAVGNGVGDKLCTNMGPWGGVLNHVLLLQKGLAWPSWGCFGTSKGWLCLCHLSAWRPLIKNPCLPMSVECTRRLHWCLSLQGFQQLKVLRSGRQVSCFVEYDTIENASQCHATQQVRVTHSKALRCGQHTSMHARAAAATAACMQSSGLGCGGVC